MNVAARDWRQCGDDVDGLVAAEAREWLEQLHWNVAESWSVIAPARRSGRLPGLAACDAAGTAVGWAAFVPHAGYLQVMAIAAPEASTAAVLVDAILDTADARQAVSTIVCVRDGTPGLADVLRTRGFDIEPYRYLSVDLAAPGATRMVTAPEATRLVTARASTGVAPRTSIGVVTARAPTGVVTAARGPMRRAIERWNDDGAPMARLCARAYAGTRDVRAFAPGGTEAEWRHYVSSLTEGTGCGWFAPELSVVVPGAEAGEIDAALLLTDLGPGTAHIAQMAVDPAMQGQGLGRQIMSSVLDEAAALFSRVTLLVAASNTPAVRLYESFGFRDHASFIVAQRRTGADD